VSRSLALVSVDFYSRYGVRPPLQLHAVARDGSAIGFRRQALSSREFEEHWFTPGGAEVEAPRDVRSLASARWCGLYGHEPPRDDEPPSWPEGYRKRSQQSGELFYVEVSTPLGKRELHRVGPETSERVDGHVPSDTQLEAIGGGRAVRASKDTWRIVRAQGPDLVAELPTSLRRIAREWRASALRQLFYLPEADVLVFISQREGAWVAAEALRAVEPGEALGGAGSPVAFEVRTEKPKRRRPVLRKKERERLAILQEAGLFGELDDALLRELAHLVGGSDRLASAVDTAFVHGKLHDPAVRSIQSVWPGLGVEAVLREEDGRLRLTDADGTVRELPNRTHHDWAAAHNEALRVLGDPRRLVGVPTDDWEEPLFVICDPAGAAALAATGLVDEGY